MKYLVKKLYIAAFRNVTLMKGRSYFQIDLPYFTAPNSQTVE